MNGGALPYRHLRRLFEAYVHQDWPAEGPTPDAAIRRFLREAGDDARAGARRDLDRLLARTRSEAALEAALDRLGCGYSPRAAGTGARAWLLRVRGLLAEGER